MASNQDAEGHLKAALAHRYRIDREIGSGGMATVYLARDLRHDREVAVKVLRSEVATTLAPDRFLREIRIAANLNHPHILPVFDSGEVDGFLYYVMPFEEGQSLRQKLAREGELPVAEAVRLLRDVVDALTHAHAKGVVHRDIKPANVLLSGRHALVTDFGVAKAVSEVTGSDKLTAVGWPWEHPRTWRRSKQWPTSMSTIEPTSTPPAFWPTSCSRDGLPSWVAHRRGCSRRM